MNKEVIYLEPDDDITDILTKLQRAEQKLVALVPPKKATMFRSAVNMKLVAKAAKECDKVAVLVTSDPAVVKLAMAAQIPVAKTLQSRPVVPTPEMVKASEQSEQVINEDLDDAESKAELDSLKDKKASAKTPAEATESASEKTSAKGAVALDLTEESLQNGSKDAKKGDKKAKDDKKVPSLDKYRKWILVGVGTAIILAVLGVWAFVFAPAVKITVAMSTSSSNFSEDVKFTTDANAAQPEEGLFLAEKRTYEQKYNADFTATGKEDRGDKATGTVVVTAKFNPTANLEGYSFALKAGTRLTATSADGRSVSYSVDEAVEIIDWDGTTSALSALGCSMTVCTKSASVKVTAVEAGEKYNIGAGRSWNPIEGATLSNTVAFTGGTSREVTFVSQSDIDKAKEELLSSHQIDGKDALLAQVSSDANVIAIESSFASEAGEVTVKPELNAEVASDVTPQITVNAVYSIYTVSKTQIETYVNTKATVADDQKIYSIGEPYFERFTSIEEGAKLKTVIKTGPTVTEEDILAKSKGRKIGEVQSLLRSINGVSSVEIKPSYFWVRSVPNDEAKITIELTVEDK